MEASRGVQEVGMSEMLISAGTSPQTPQTQPIPANPVFAATLWEWIRRVRRVFQTSALPRTPKTFRQEDF